MLFIILGSVFLGIGMLSDTNTYPFLQIFVGVGIVFVTIAVVHFAAICFVMPNEYNNKEIKN